MHVIVNKHDYLLAECYDQSNGLDTCIYKLALTSLRVNVETMHVHSSAPLSHHFIVMTSSGDPPGSL